MNAFTDRRGLLFGALTTGAAVSVAASWAIADAEKPDGLQPY
jgi:hypothetical protein